VCAVEVELRGLCKWGISRLGENEAMILCLGSQDEVGLLLMERGPEYPIIHCVNFGLTTKYCRVSVAPINSFHFQFTHYYVFVNL
jgi:hypothetical protein